jgi:hypothetical protein
VAMASLPSSLSSHAALLKSEEVLECGFGEGNRKGCGVRRGVRAVKVLLFVLSWSRYLPSGASHNSLIPSSSCGCRLDDALNQITSTRSHRSLSLPRTRAGMTGERCTVGVSVYLKGHVYVCCSCIRRLCKDSCGAHERAVT